MIPTPSARRGAGSRGLVVILAALVLLAIVLWRFLAAPPALDPAQFDSADAPPAQTNTVPALSGETLELDTADSGALVARGNMTPVGVRLSGPGRLDGRVLDRVSGLGVGGLSVELLPVPVSGGNFLGRMMRMANLSEMAQRVHPIAVARTAPDGAFSFAGVRTGTWYLDSRGPYHVPENNVRARVVASGSGGPLDVWVRAGGRVLGQVFLPDGRPAVGATVELVPGPGIFIERARTGDLVFLEAKAEADGSYVFEGCPPGEGYEVTVAGNGFALTHALGVVVRAGEDTRVDVRTKAGGTISGLVVSAPKTAEGEEPGERKPLGGAHLGAVPRGLRDLRCAEELLLSTHCVSGPDGRFTMPNVPAGEIDLIAIAPQHLPALGARLAVADGMEFVAPDFVLHPGPMLEGRVVDSAGAPVPGAQLRWNLVDWQNFQFDFSLAPMMAQAVEGFEYPTSDADGRFVAGPFAGKAPYNLDVQKLGFQPARFEWNPEKQQEAVTITLRRGGSIEGVVMDELASEPVTLFTIATRDRVDTEAGVPGARNPFTGGTTIEDPAGRFKLDALETGKVELVFSAPGYLDKSLADVEIREGQPTRGLIVSLTPGGTLRGVVVDGQDQPVPGAQVAAFPSGEKELANTPASNLRRERNDRRRQFGRMPMEQLVGDMPPGFTNFFASLGLLGDKAVLTDAQGAFEIRGVTPGEVRVLAFHREFASGSAGPIAVPQQGEAAGVKIVMNSGGGIEGRVNDRHGRPVTGSIVVALSSAAMTGGGDPSGGAIYQGESGAEGRFKMRHMQAGAYFLVATRGDEALNPMSFFSNLNLDLVTVPPGEIVNYDVVDSSAGGCRVYGTITCNGAPVERGSLTALNFESESSFGVDFKVAQVKEGGRFEFPGLAPGDYQLNLDGRGPQVRLRLEVPDAPELAVALHCPEGGVEGIVRDAASGAPVQGVEVFLRARQGGRRPTGLIGSLMGREGNALRATTDKNGAFAIASVPGGPYELIGRPRGDARKSYGPSEPLRLRVDEDRVTGGLELKLPPALSIVGTVKDAQGAPVKGARVIARGTGEENTTLERDQTDDEGRYELKGLAPGAYELVASADEYADTLVGDIELAKDAKTAREVAITLEKGVLVFARIYGPDGRPAAGARARLVRKGASSATDVADAGRMVQGLFTGEGTSDAEGRVIVGRYRPGEYRLEVQRSNARGEVDSVKVPGGTDEYEVRAELPQ